jgi:adenylate cyclase
VPLAVGIGIAAGAYVEAGGTYVGTTIKLAQRICALAGPGEILVSEPVRRAVDEMPAATLAERGLAQLQGFPEPLAVFRVASSPHEKDKV